MTKLKLASGKLISLLLAFVMTVSIAVMLQTPSYAAGAGYSDLIRIYALEGVDRNENISVIAFMYGRVDAPKDNYVAVLKRNNTNGNLTADVLSTEEFDKMLKNAIMFSQTDVAHLNEYLLKNGAPEEYISLYERPMLVYQLLDAFAQKKTSVTIKDEVMIFPDALKLAAEQGGKDFRINFDSLKDDSGSVDVRLTVNPSACTKGFATLATTDSEVVDYTINIFNKFYSNKFACVAFLQDKSFGTTVNVAAKVDLSGLDTSKLHFYSYSVHENQISTIENTNYFIDENGYLHFDTTYAGNILITDKPLAKI